MAQANPKNKVALRTIGQNDTRIWGMSSAERITRIASKRGIEREVDAAQILLVSTAYAFDPAWIDFMLERPASVLTVQGAPAMAMVPAEHADAAEQTMLAGALPPGVTPLALETCGDFYNKALRKIEKPFFERLTPQSVRSIERQSYFGAYKGVTDILTKYLWPEWALVLTRLAARLGVTPNMVTAIGAIFCVAATIAFWHGDFWSGMAMGLAFMVLDTVDGKLARCTITSSKWGNVFDHGIDLIHPPFWWYAWGIGLIAYGLPLSSGLFGIVLATVVFGYIFQRLIEGDFIRRYGMDIHVWKKIDSDFRLITARRNPNMVILFVSMLLARPDLGLIALAVWTFLSLIFHAVRLWQAWRQEARGEPIRSWLEVA